MNRYLDLGLEIDGTNAYKDGRKVFSFSYRESARHVYKHQSTTELLSLISKHEHPEKEIAIEFIREAPRRFKNYYDEDEYWMAMDFIYERFKKGEHKAGSIIYDLEELIWRSEKRREEVFKHVDFKTLLELLSSGIDSKTIMKAVEYFKKNKKSILTFEDVLKALQDGKDLKEIQEMEETKKSLKTVVKTFRKKLGLG